MTDKELIEIAKSVSAERKLTPAANIGGVGAALITDKGNIYKGTCIDCSCGIGFCAEHSAIAAMLTDGETRIAKIVALNEGGEIMPPCGRCRELICQIDFDNLATEVLLSEAKTVTINELLPHNWLSKYIGR